MVYDSRVPFFQPFTNQHLLLWSIVCLRGILWDCILFMVGFFNVCRNIWFFFTHNVSIGGRASTRIFFLSDVICHILFFLPYKDLMQMASCHTAVRCSVQTVLRLRFYSSIRPYVGVDVLSFCRALRDFGTVVCGSSALWILMFPCGWTPNNLNFITPFGTLGSVVGVLQASGYEMSRERRIRRSEFAFNDQMETFVLLTHVFHGRQVSVVEAPTNSIFPTLLRPLDTSLTTIANADGVLCLYPKLTFACLRLCSRIGSNTTASAVRHKKSKRLGFISRLDTTGFDEVCGLSCPVLTRRVCGLRGAAWFDWSLDGKVGDVDRMLQLALRSHYKWRLGNGCYNKNCPFGEVF